MQCNPDNLAAGVTSMKNLAILIVLNLALMPSGHAERYRLPSEAEPIVGQLAIISTQYEDTFLKLARKFDIGFQELVIANPAVDPWLPGEGTQVVLPTQYILPGGKRKGLVLNLAEMRLYYYPENPEGTPEYVHTYPISIGRQGWNTPRARTRIVRKKKGSYLVSSGIHPQRIRAKRRLFGGICSARSGQPIGQVCLVHGFARLRDSWHQ